MRPVHAAMSVALLAAAPPLAAQPLHQFGSLTLSADGERVATIDSSKEADALKSSHEQVVVRDAQGGRVLLRLDPCKACDYSDLVYGPDRRLLFIARDRASGRSTLMAWSSGRTARRVVTVNGLAADPRWSPDGRSIAMLVTVDAHKEAGATQAGVRQIGEIGDHYDERRIGVVPAGGGALRIVSPGDRYVYEYDWKPDGSGFVATTALGNGDANWWVATLDTIDLADGEVHTIARPGTQMNFPRVSPDGRTVAFIGGLMSDFGSVGGDVWTVPLPGGTPKDITKGYRGTFTSLLWGKDGLKATALLGDKAALVPIDPEGGAGEPVWTAPVSIAAGDAKLALGGGRMAMVAQDYEHGPAIFAGPVGRPVQITSDNNGYGAIGQARSIRWRSGGYDVQGWLVAPRGASFISGPAPLITNVHGGPAAATTPRFVWEGTDAALLKAGYWLFFPNPRGSYGQGEAFTQANRRDFGGGDLKDILAGIDAVEKEAPIDDSRLGLMGGSYGGFMAMWANTQTDRFKAIWADAGLSDWISYYGTNGINSWMIPYFGKSMYNDQKAYWDVSAIQFIHRARTPTLITVGERDIEVPPTQSVEYWNGLKAFNVPTTLVIYPDEGHWIRQPEHRADMQRRAIGWFDKYLKGN